MGYDRIGESVKADRKFIWTIARSVQTNFINEACATANYQIQTLHQKAAVSKSRLHWGDSIEVL